MAKRVGKYKLTKRDSDISIVDGGTISGNVTLNGSLTGGTNAADNVIKQFDGTEVARIHDGGVVPTATGTSTSLTAGTGLGLRRRVLTLGSGNNDNVLTLTAADCGAVIYVTPTNNLSITLPTVGTETGLWFDIIIAANHNKTFTIKTGGQDGNDNITVHNVIESDTAANIVQVDVGGSDHDILTFTNALVGSRIELINCAGGAAEEWHAYVRSMDAVVGTIA